jgi:DNA polymerase (family 10)
MDNPTIARIFADVADLLEIQGGANVFRIRAYRNAARTVESLGASAEAAVRTGAPKLDELPGIGKDLAGKIKEIVETGKLPLLEELKAKIPVGVLAMMRLPGLGPKRAKQIHAELGIDSLEALDAAARAGKLRAIKGLGPTLESRIVKSIADAQIRSARHRLADAEAVVGPYITYLKKAPGIQRIEAAGSYRRRAETVGDIDILVTAKKAGPVAERFVAYPDVTQVLAKGDTRSSVVLRSGLQVDLRVVPDASYGAALYYFTGSKAHNVAVRTEAVRRKLKINEYGVFRGQRRVAGRTEEDVFKAMRLPWIPPELRENRGEIQAAAAGELPTLVTVKDIRGDLQMHTTYTDGKQTLAEMAEACRKRGYQYIAVTDHSKAVRVAGGLEATDFRRQYKEIDKLQKTLKGLTLLKSAEVDILDDGALDLEEGILAEMDVVVVSVHSKFNMSRADMTRRIVKALQHPRVNILAHPTGRLLGRREPYQVDMEEVVKAARDHGVMLEINAQPHRLDLNDAYAFMAREAGVKLVVSTDAHRVAELDHMRHGVDQARRAWCEKADVANTLPLAKFRALLQKRT